MLGGAEARYVSHEWELVTTPVGGPGESGSTHSGTVMGYGVQGELTTQLTSAAQLAALSNAFDPPLLAM